ncbi:MAG: hypothetical protein Q9174_004478, partial [Haloplaca sp. 1 TL-2023]
MALVSDSSLVTSPQLCVSRQISACSICRGKKIKCDGLVPVCTPCQKSRRDVECTNGSDQFARGKERSYVTALETRLDKLEKSIARSKSRGNTATQNHHVSASYAVPPSTARATRIERKEEAHVNELVSDFGFLYAHDQLLESPQFLLTTLILAPSTVCTLPESDGVVLPPRPEVISLVQQYVDHDLTLCPFISETKIFGSIEALFGQHGAPSDYWTVYIILAITMVSLATSRKDSRYHEAVRYAGAALKHAKMVLLPGSLQAIQMILLLVQYSTYDPYHFDSWYLIGAAARMVVDLGLHQDPPRSARMNDAQLDLRRRIFYAVYAYDRATTLVHRRAFSFTDDSTNVASCKLPNAIPSGLSKEGSPAMQVIQLRKAVSAPYQALFQSGPAILEDPWPIIGGAHHTMDEWETHLLESNLQEAYKLAF